jgi:hypothetical protein
MKLYFNGCSFTHGDELQNPSESAWPVLVSRHYKKEFLNDGISGGTNQRTVYKTILNIDQFDFFVIAWTDYSRFTLYNPVDNFEINFNPMLNLDASLHTSDDLKKNYKKYKEYGTLYYKHWFNDLYEFKKWLQQILMLQAFFNIKNKKYMMLNTFPNYLSNWLQPKENFIKSIKSLCTFFDYLNDDQLLQEHYQIQSMVSMIDAQKFIQWGDWTIKDLSKQCAIGPGGHILEDGHKKLSTIVIDHIDQHL